MAKKSTVNIKKMLRDNREDELVKMKNQRKKMMQLIFKKDFKTLHTELQALKKHSPGEN